MHMSFPAPILLPGHLLRLLLQLLDVLFRGGGLVAIGFDNTLAITGQAFLPVTLAVLLALETVLFFGLDVGFAGLGIRVELGLFA